MFSIPNSRLHFRGLSCALQPTTTAAEPHVLDQCKPECTENGLGQHSLVVILGMLRHLPAFHDIWNAKHIISNLNVQYGKRVFNLLWSLRPDRHQYTFAVNCAPSMQLETIAQMMLLHSFIPGISIAPLQVLYYSEALRSTARILYRSFTWPHSR